MGADVKLDRKESLHSINEICELKSCSSCVFFEMRKHHDVYMWVARAGNGPSVKFLVENSASLAAGASRRGFCVAPHAPSAPSPLDG